MEGILYEVICNPAFKDDIKVNSNQVKLVFFGIESAKITSIRCAVPL